MATTVKRKLSTTEAAKLARGALGLNDLHRLAIALAEVAAEETLHSRVFADRVRLVYEQVPTPSHSSRPDPFAARLVPIKIVEGRDINPAAPLDADFLLEVYGGHQFPDALGLYPVAKLKEAAKRIADRKPGTKPAHWGQKTPLIEYIVRHTQLR